MKNKEKRHIWGVQKSERKKVGVYRYNEHNTRYLGESKEKKKRVFF